MAGPAAAAFVQPEAYTADGAPIPPDAIPEAVASGQAFFKKGARIAAKNQAGEVVTIAAEDAGHPGYTVLSPAQVEQAHAQKQYGEGLGNVAKAGVAGAARGLTLGASDAVLAGIGGEDTRRALQDLRAANPLTSTVSELGGAIAPLALSGGAAAPAEAAEAASLLARGGEAAGGVVRSLGAGHRAIAGVGSLVERGAARGLEALGIEGTSLAGRVGAGAVKLGARGAAEGALYGGAQAANDAVLNGDEITAEKIVAGMGNGALFGGAVGGALGAAGPLATAAASKLVPNKAALTQLAREQGLKGAGFKGSDFRRLAGRATGEAADARIAATADDLMNTTLETGALKGERVLRPGANVEETLERVSQAKSEAAARLSGLKAEIDEGMTAAGHAPDVGEFLRRVKSEVTDPLIKSAVPGVRSEARAVERQLSVLREQFDDQLNKLGLENSRYLRDGMRDMGSIRAAYEGATPEEVQAIALGERAPMGSVTGKPLEPVRVALYPGEAPVLGDGRHRMFAAKEAGADSVMARVVRYDGEGNVISETLRPVSIAPKAGPTFRELDRFRQDLRSVFQPIKPPGGGLPAPPPKGAAALEKTERVLQDYLKEEAGVFLAKTGENPNAYNEANRLYHSFRQLEDVGTKTANQSLGNRSVSPSDHALGVASFLGALTTGGVGALGSMGYGAAATVANKLLRERGNSVVADMARRAAEMDSSIDRVAQSLAGRAEKVKAPALAATLQGENLRETYERTANRVRELAAPQAAQAHISSLIPEVAAQYPLVGASVSTKLLNIYQQLVAKIPPNHVDTGTTLTPLAIKERIPPAAMRTFLANVRGALAPAQVIDELEHGVVDREGIEALKAAHPKTFQQLREKVADYVQSNETELPYKRRVMLSMTFDFVGDGSLEPQRMAASQEATQALSFQEAAQDAQAIKPKSGDPGVSKLGKSLTTPMDSALSGGT